MNSIKFESVVPSFTSEIEETLHDFFKEIKADVYEKAKASQKKYIVFKDLCTAIRREDILKKLDNNLEYFDAKDYSFGYSWTNIKEYNSEIHEVKNFNEEYERFARFFIFVILKQREYCNYVTLDFVIEFHFTDFSDGIYVTPNGVGLPLMCAPWYRDRTPSKGV